MLFMGIDVGTSGCKVAVFDEDGKLVSINMREYSLTFPKVGWMELCPNTVWECILDCVTECKKDVKDKIAAVAVSSQGEAIIPVDKNGKVLHNSIVTFDNRCSEEVKTLKTTFGEGDLNDITGAPIHSMFSLPKILWIKNNLPDIYKKTWKFMCYGDFISYKLGAEPCIDYTMATRTQMFDIKNKVWSKNIIDKVGLDEDKLPKAAKSGEVIGKCKFLDNALIVAGAHDQSCCAIGAGVTKPNTVMDSMGTTETTLCVSENLITDEKITGYNIPCCIYANNDLYAYLAFLTSSGSVLRWYKDLLIRDDTPFNQYDRIAQERPRPSPVMMLPYFSGSGTPHMDDKATGVFSGLTLGTDRIDIYLAILEGTAFEAARNVEIMKDCGIDVDEIRCIGGGAKSDIWMQIKADAFGMPVTVMKVNETGCLGAAALAASGLFGSSINEITNRWCKKGKVYLPNKEQHEIYKEAMLKQRALY